MLSPATYATVTLEKDIATRYFSASEIALNSGLKYTLGRDFQKARIIQIFKSNGEKRK
jgi:hypothetical protein